MKKKLAKVPALEQRMAIRQYLRPLDTTEVADMLLYRLRVAGYSEEQSPFTPDAIYEMHKFSKGIPRLTSQLADNAMMYAYVRKEKSIDGFLMHQVVLEYQGVEEAA